MQLWTEGIRENAALHMQAPEHSSDLKDRPQTNACWDCMSLLNVTDRSHTADAAQYLPLVLDILLAACHLSHTGPPLTIVALVQYAGNSKALISLPGEGSCILILRTSADIPVRTDAEWKANARRLLAG
jgi:hypothetical protein